MKRIWQILMMALAVWTLGCGGGGGGGTPSPTPAPVLTALAPSSGAVGTTVTLTGRHLAGTSAVKFNGSAATFTLNSDTQVTATVPAGATSGTVTLTTPGGTATSSASFTITSAGTRSFWVNDLDTAGTWIQAPFTQAYQNDRCTVWVHATEQDKITAALLQHYGDYFAQHSWPDVTGYVHTPTEFFGEAGNRINILFYTTAKDLAGYFWEKDFYSQADLIQMGYSMKSNETNVFYMNIEAAVIATNQARATLFTEGTLTHEFQHMCNAHYFTFDTVGEAKTRSMDSWANEFCSVTMESVFAGQLDIYVPSYRTDSAFRNGGGDFLQWRNDFTQYTAVSLLGSYLLSQMPDDAHRAAFYRSFLAHTQVEKTTGSQSLTSVEDLLATLQDSSIGWTPAGWTTVSDFVAEGTHVRDNWSAVLKAFTTGLTGQNTTYNAYLASHSAQTMTPVCATATGGSFALNPSGFFIGKTQVANLASEVITDASNDASGRQSAYAIVYDATLPSRDLLDSETQLPTATTAVTATQFLRSLPEEAKVMTADAEGYRFNRAMGPRFGKIQASTPAFRTTPTAKASDRATIPGAGNAANGGSATAGYNYCFYVAR